MFLRTSFSLIQNSYLALFIFHYILAHDLDLQLTVAAVTQAETQLANTSLNGMDLFNGISDTSIPTVVESINARIDETSSAGGFVKEIPNKNNGVLVSTIKQEGECK